MKRILVMSDTHGINIELMKKVIDNEKCDLNVHCGDFLIDDDTMNSLFDYWVYGNNDEQALTDHNIVSFECEGFHFLLLHGHQAFAFSYDGWLKKLYEIGKEKKVDVLLFGHSHCYEETFYANKLFLANPGSLCKPRDYQASYMIITINNREINFIKKTV